MILPNFLTHRVSIGFLKVGGSYKDYKKINLQIVLMVGPYQSGRTEETFWELVTAWLIGDIYFYLPPFENRFLLWSIWKYYAFKSLLKSTLENFRSFFKSFLLYLRGFVNSLQSCSKYFSPCRGAADSAARGNTVSCPFDRYCLPVSLNILLFLYSENGCANSACSPCVYQSFFSTFLWWFFSLS